MKVNWFPMTSLAQVHDPPVTVGHGRYDVREAIGHGGVGMVYRAIDNHQQTAVALKVLQPRFVGTNVELRFLREAEALERHRHHNVVRVLHVGRDEPFAWMAMELMNRGTAHALAKKRAGLPVSWCLHIADSVLAGLASVHAAGWVHRDVKPGNVLLDHTGTVKLGDFGILRDLNSDLTSPGVTLGTHAYMSPEQQIDATRVTPRSDIWGLGATLFALAVGRTPKDLSRRSRDGNEAEEMFGALPRPLQPLIRRSCQLDPRRRFGSAGDMRRAVREILQALRRRESTDHPDADCR